MRKNLKVIKSSKFKGLSRAPSWLQITTTVEEYVEPDYYNRLLKDYVFGGRSDIEIFSDFLASVNKKDCLKILELGCGSGRATKVFFDNFLNIKYSIDLVDLSSRMLNFCKKIFKNNKEINFIQSDSIAHLFKTTEIYDFIFSLWSFSHSIHQVLTKKGVKEGARHIKGSLRKMVEKNMKKGSVLFIIHFDSLSEEQRILMQQWKKVFPIFKNIKSQSPSKLLIDEIFEEFRKEGLIDFKRIQYTGDMIEYKSIDEALEIFLNFHMESYFNESALLPGIINELNDYFKKYQGKDGKVLIQSGCFVYIMTKNKFMSTALVRPNKLVRGDTVGIIAPSAGSAALFPHRIENAKKLLEKSGYKVKFAKHSLGRKGYFSSEIHNRVADIHEMFKDDDVRAILCTIGGNHSNQLLKAIDYGLVKNKPKIFVGYSDISVLHYAFAKKANLGTFYGPCLMTQFGEYPEILPYTLKYFNKAVVLNLPIGKIEQSEHWTAEILDWNKKKDLERPRKLNKAGDSLWLKEGTAEGVITGGCVPSINHLMGTEYWMDPAGSVFFIDIPEGHNFGEGLSIPELDAYLTDLDNIGVFENIAGLIIGRPYNYSEEEIVLLKNIIFRITDKYTYPVLLNVNIGHCDPIITLPYGVNVTLDSGKNEFIIKETGVL